MAQSNGLDGILLRNRSYVGYTLAAAFLFFVGMFIAALLGTPVLGLTVSETLSGLLALGTLALAYAALVQAVLVFASHLEARADRVKDREPHLRVRSVVREVTRSEKIDWDPSKTEMWTFKERVLMLGNLGPGIAANIKGRRIEAVLTEEVWTNSRAGESVRGEPSDPYDHLERRETEWDVEVDYLAPNEEVELAAPDEWTSNPTPDGDFTTLVFGRFACTDLENRAAEAAEGGLEYARPLAEDPNPNPPDYIRADIEHYRTNSRWGFVSKLEETRLGPKKNPPLRTGPSSVKS